MCVTLPIGHAVLRTAESVDVKLPPGLRARIECHGQYKTAGRECPGGIGRRRDAGRVWKRRLRVVEQNAGVRRGDGDLRGLFAYEPLRLLDVREVGVELQRDVARDPFARSVRHGDADPQSSVSDLEAEMRDQRALRYAEIVSRNVVARLAASPAAVAGDFGIDELELQLAWGHARRFAEPRPLAADEELTAAEMARLAEVEARQRDLAAGTADVGDEQGAAVPRVELARTDSRGLHRARERNADAGRAAVPGLLAPRVWKARRSSSAIPSIRC